LRPEIVTRMEIDLDQIVHNYREVVRHVCPAEVYAVIKSEAYGHGAVPVARALSEAGCRTLAVALVDEGIQLRRAGIGGTIMVKGASLPWQYPAILEHDLVPVLPDAERMGDWDRVAREAGRQAGFHIKVDVGLGRLGMMPWQGEEAARVAAGLSHARLLGISGHLSSPGGSPEQNQLEERYFHEFCEPVRARFPEAARHLAASQAVACYSHMNLELVRIGGLIYGLQHVTDHGMDLRPAMTFKTAVGQVKELPAGWGIGYNRRWVLDEPMRMAVLPMGWTDIFNSQMVGNAEVLIGGVGRRLVGVCTDFAMVDVSEEPVPAPGDEVVIIGSQGDRTITAIELGRRGGISTGQLLGKISLRVPRIYTSGGREIGELSVLGPS